IRVDSQVPSLTLGSPGPSQDFTTVFQEPASALSWAWCSPGAASFIQAAIISSWDGILASLPAAALADAPLTAGSLAGLLAGSAALAATPAASMNARAIGTSGVFDMDSPPPGFMAYAPDRTVRPVDRREGIRAR